MDEKIILQITVYTLKLADQNITPEEFEELNSILSANPDAARHYNCLMMAISNFQGRGKEIICDELSIESDLKDTFWREMSEYEKAAPEIEISQEKPQHELIQKVVYDKTSYRISKFNIFATVSSAAAILLIVLGSWFLKSESPRPVASITSSIDASWVNSNGTNKVGKRLWNDGGWYQLTQGMAEVTFDGGAKVLVESPSQFKVLNENEMSFQGMLTAEVPVSAYGFTVNTANSKVVDLGTEFGLVSSVTNGTEVHVRKGKVQIAQAAPDIRNPLIQLIEAGQGGRISSSGTLSRIEYEKDKFYWDMPSPYEYAVKKTNPVYYWRFDRGPDGILRNEMAPQAEPGDSLAGRLDFDNGPTIGGDQPNRALCFSGSKDNYVVIYDNPRDYAGANGLSIVMWIHPAVSKAQDIIVHRKKNASSIHTDEITLTEDNRVGFYVFCPPELPQPWPYEVRITGYHLVLSNPIPLNQWTHVAATYTNSDRMNLYINGQLEASRKLSGSVQKYPEIDCWYIGSEWQDFEKEIKVKPRSFIGSVDEISRYNRELSAEEIRMLYESAGKDP